MDLSNNKFAKWFPSIAHAERYARLCREVGYIILKDPNKKGVPVGLFEEETSNEHSRKEKEDCVMSESHDDHSSIDQEVMNSEEQTDNDKSSVDICAESSKQDNAIILLIEEVFNLTFTNHTVEFKSKETHLVYLKDVICENSSNILEVLEQALFERLLIDDPSNHLIFLNNKASGSSSRCSLHAVEKECITYLFECYRRLKERILSNLSHELKETVFKMIGFVVRNAATALKQPDIYEPQQIHLQVINLFRVESGTIEELTDFFSAVAFDIKEEDGVDSLQDVFNPVLNVLHQDIAKFDILTFPRSHFSLILIFSSIPLLAEVVITNSTPKEMTSVGGIFAQTLLGAALSLSCLPKYHNGMFEFFNKPHDGTANVVEGRIWTAIKDLVEMLHSIFLVLLKSSPATRLKTLNWIAGCLDQNVARGRLSALNMFSLENQSCVADAFMLNLTGVLLRLSEPFTSSEDYKKLLRIDPTYPAAKNVPDVDNGVHMKKLSDETCLVPSSEEAPKPCSKGSFSFITECFFMTHRALKLGFHVVLDKTQILYQEIARMQRALEDQNAGPHLETLRERMEMNMTRYLSFRCALLEPSALSQIRQFHVATAVWLVQVAVDPDLSETRESFAPCTQKEVKFPLPDSVAPALRCVPEMLLENLAAYLVFVKRFIPNSLEEGGQSVLEPILTVLLVFMSGCNRARNPHLRASLAECLECLIGKDLDNPGQTMMGTFFRDRLFQQHPHRNQIVESLLDVFVSIEMTGQSVSFEQKFNYRRPMYTVMSYLWSLEEQRLSFKKLAAYAEENMEAVNPPLFLRFINLLMNDGVFLLDEALSHMATLRNLQAARDAGEWAEMPLQEQERNEAYFEQTGQIARLYNILGKETILTLEYLTSEISSIFCHSTMVDRIAAMLNYFLLHLVGPKKKNLKVKEQNKYKFEPASIVLYICQIYVHLSKSKDFCAAVSRDGRSYSPQLFSQAEDVLARIGGLGLIADLQSVAEEVKCLAKLQQKEDELLADVPDDFLDPIMSTLMTDPVTLPSSKQVVDRSTIARHLLSDQSDPFNRAPLTMDMVISNLELKERIESWVAERKAENK